MSFRGVTDGIIRGGGTASVTRAGGTTSPRVEECEIPELRTKAQAPMDVTLTRSSRERIHDDLFALTRSDGKEAGGFLFGRPFWARDKRIEITHATRTWEAKRTESSLLLDPAAWYGTEQAIEHDGTDEVMLGCWHCHPRTRDRTPSDGDLRAWLSMLDFFEGRRYHSAAHVGLIYSARFDWLGESSWALPEASAWIVRREGYSQRPVCEPATFEGRA